MKKKKSKRRLCAAVSKNGRIFIGNGWEGIKEQIRQARIANHNVIMFLCTQKGGDGELTIKQVGRKAKFRIDGVQQRSLTKACKCFSTQNLG